MLLDVHYIAKDLVVEVESQNKKLKRIDAELSDAKKNVILGNDELTDANDRHKSGNKYLISIFLCLLVFVSLLIAFLVWKWTR
jgi:t-SNARE complex subunit (syntaxin)